MNKRTLQSISIGFLLLTLSALGACTRERPTPDETNGFAVPITPSGTITRPGDDAGATAFPVLTSVATSVATPDLTATVSVPTATPIGAGALPALPSNEDLTPLPSTQTPTPSAQGPTFSYQIQGGDSLSAIADQFNTTVSELIALNNLADPENLQVGESIIVPGEAPPGTITSEGYIHVVEAGETLFSIAQQYSVALDQLAAANSITDPNSLQVGQRLLIPTTNIPTPTEDNSRAIHIVQAGETLSAIASQYGVSPQAIMQANDLEDANRIIVGQQLIIP